MANSTETNQLNLKMTALCNTVPCSLAEGEVWTASIPITLMMQSVIISGSTVYFYGATRHRIPEGFRLQTHSRKNLKFHKICFAEMNNMHSYAEMTVDICQVVTQGGGRIAVPTLYNWTLSI
jgi:hypothetical protein